MQRIAALLDGFDKDISKVLKIRQAWTAIAGDVLAAHTEPVHLASGKLYIMCDAPIWVQQVGILKANLCEQIRTIVGMRIKTCEGRFGRVERIGDKRKQRIPAMRPALAKEDVERIRDPELRERLQKLLTIEDDPVHE